MTGKNLYFRTKGDIKIFPDKHNLREFITRRPYLMRKIIGNPSG